MTVHLPAFGEQKVARWSDDEQLWVARFLVPYATRDGSYPIRISIAHEDGLVEWIDRVPAAAPADWLEVRLSDTGENARRLEARGHGARGDSLLEGWLLEP